MADDVDTIELEDAADRGVRATPQKAHPSTAFADPDAQGSIGGEVKGDPFERDRWLVYDDAYDIQVFQAEAEFIATVDGRWLPDAYATRDDAVLAAERTRDASE